MDIFAFLEEEVLDIEKKLKELIENYSEWSREHVFDRVKLICDAIGAHTKKEKALLVENVDTTSSEMQSLMTEYNKDRAKLTEEVGQLVMVHVDEPEYQECLGKLRKVVEEHVTFSRKFYADLKKNMTQSQVELSNQQLSDVVRHSVDYNTIQP
jgi:hypothetical protein